MLQAALGWKAHVDEPFRKASFRNFPLQANASEMLRVACLMLADAGIRVCATIHDAVLIEAPIDKIDEAVAIASDAMQQASKFILQCMSLRTEAKVVRYPDRYIDERGRPMWQTVMTLLDQSSCTANATC